MSSTTIPTISTTSPGQGGVGEQPSFSIIIIVVPVSAMVLSLLMFILAKCWFPERFGYRRRSSQSDTDSTANVQQDKPPSYEEILRNDNPTELPTYSESLEQLANMVLSPSSHSNEDLSTSTNNNSHEATPPISIIFTNEIMLTETDIDTDA